MFDGVSLVILPHSPPTEQRRLLLGAVFEPVGCEPRDATSL